MLRLDHKRRQRICITFSLLILIIAACFCFLNPVIVHSSFSETVKTYNLIGEIVKDSNYSQTFTVSNETLSGFQLLLFHYARENTGTVIVSLHDVTNDRAIQTWSVDVAGIKETTTQAFILSSPVQLQEETLFRLDITSPDCYTGNAITLWATRYDDYPAGSFFQNGISEPIDICFTLQKPSSPIPRFVELTIVFLFSMTLVLFSIFYFSPKRNKKTTSFLQTWVFLSMLTAITLLLYRDYLMGIRLYVFTDTANDSFYQALPNLYRTAQLLEAYGRLPAWDFAQTFGLGRSTFLNILNQWPALFGVEHVSQLLGLSQAFKVLLAGGFFYAFMRTAKISFWAASVSALGYAFCGHMIARAAWTGYPGEVVAVALVLLVVECFYQQKRSGLLLPAAVFFLALCKGLYTSIIYVAIFSVYLLFRYCTENQVQWKELLSMLGKFLLLYGAGLCLSAVLLLPEILQLPNSARMEAATADVNQLSLLKRSDKQTLMTAFLRLFSNDMQGGILNYRGAMMVYHAAPAFYCGLLSLLVLPHAFRKTDKKQKIWYALALLAAFAYCFFENLRLIANGFANINFKLSSFWITILLLFLAAKAVDGMLQNQKINRRLLFYSLECLFLPATLMLSIENNNINLILLLIVLCFLLAYRFLLLRLSVKPSLWLRSGVLVLVAIEVFVLSFPAVNQRNTASQRLVDTTYQNGLRQLVDGLKKDDLDLFRVDYPTNGPCQLFAQGIMGTRGYVGGAVFSKFHTDFINAVKNDNTDQIGFSRVVLSFAGANEINTFLGTKYLIYSVEDWPYFYSPYGYQEIDSPDPAFRVFENQYALPMFFGYDQTMSEQEFFQLSNSDRRQALLDALVLPQAGDATRSAEEWQAQRPLKTQLEISTRELDSGGRKNALCLSLENVSDAPYLLITFSLETSGLHWYIPIMIRWGNDLESMEEDPNRQMRYMTSVGKEDGVLLIPNDGVSLLQFIPSYSSSDLTNVKVYAVDDSYFDEYRAATVERSAEPVIVTAFSEEQVQLATNFIKERYLFCSIPYDEGWHAKIDGQKAVLSRANINFIALDVPAGEHVIELYYDQFENAPWVQVVTWAGVLLWISYSVLSLRGQHRKRKV